MTPNRTVALMTAAIGLLGAISVPLANLDTTSVVGVVGGLATVTLTALKWLDGWQRYEARQPQSAKAPPLTKPERSL